MEMPSDMKHASLTPLTSSDNSLHLNPAHKKHSSPLPSASSGNSLSVTRYLLKCTVTNLWLADNQLIDDKTELYTLDPCEALAFVSPEAAAERARHLLHLIPDIMIDAVELPCRHG